jgi:cytochrome P450
MRPYTELDLYHLAVEEPWFAADPAPELEKARARHPWLATSVFGPVVTHYPVVREIHAMEGMLSASFRERVAALGALDTPWGDFAQRQMLALSGAEHKRLRDILAPAFTPRQANRHRELMRQTIRELLDEWAPRGAFDFEEFISWYPISVMCRMIGAPIEALPSLRSSLEALGLAGGHNPDVMQALQDATVTLDAYCDTLVADREARWKPGDDDDLLDALLQARHDSGLSRRELLDVLMFLYVAGYDTSKNVLTLTMYEMVRHHDMWARCAEDADYCAKVGDETMRFHGPVNGGRALARDLVHRDVLIPAGTFLQFPLSVIGQDRATAPDADRFEPERERIQAHLGFGLGAHMCLGQFIARAQIAEGLHEIAKRLRDPVSPGPGGWRPFLGVWGIRGLPIEFAPG